MAIRTRTNGSLLRPIKSATAAPSVAIDYVDFVIQARRGGRVGVDVQVFASPARFEKLMTPPSAAHCGSRANWTA